MLCPRTAPCRSTVTCVYHGTCSATPASHSVGSQVACCHKPNSAPIRQVGKSGSDATAVLRFEPVVGNTAQPSDMEVRAVGVPMLRASIGNEQSLNG